MSKIKYLFVASFFALTMSALGAGLAHASVSVNGSNDTTGPNSDNQNEWNLKQDMDVDIDNHATADSDFDVDVSTGMGHIENNTEVGDVSTGDVLGDISVTNDLNNADIAMMDLGADMGNIDVTLGNSITGPHSSNENEVTINANRDIDITNKADIDNDIDVTAKTGGMDVENNTIVGDIQTGSVRISGTVENMANQNMGSLDLSGLGSTDVSADLSNGITGPNSENENKLKVDNNLDLDVTNTAKISNDVDLNASTGGNDVGCNTVVGDISTGSVSIDFGVTNTAN